jgi:hypothetical protein
LLTGNGNLFIGTKGMMATLDRGEGVHPCIRGMAAAGRDRAARPWQSGVRRKEPALHEHPGSQSVREAGISQGAELKL